MLKNFSQCLESITSIPVQDSNLSLKNSWFLGFDTETTGLDLAREEIVSASLVLRKPGGSYDTDVVASAIAKPQQPLSPKAQEVNHFTNEFVQEHGSDPKEVLTLISNCIVEAQRRNIPLVAYNAPFDILMLEHNNVRYNLPTIAEQLHITILDKTQFVDNVERQEQLLATALDKPSMLVVDPLVIDKTIDPYRKGKRQLANLVELAHLKVHGDFHDAQADTIATLDLLPTIFERMDSNTLPFATIANVTRWQRISHADTTRGYNRWASTKPGVAQRTILWV